MDLTQLQLDTMKLPLRNKYIRLEILNYDFKVVDRIEGECVGGELSKDASSPVRRSGSVSIAIPTQYQAESIVSELDGYDITVGGKIWLDKIVRVSIGVVNYLEENSPTVWYRFGVCLIDAPTRNYTGQEYILSFNLIDYISILTSDRYGQLTGTATVVEKGEYVTNVDGTIEYQRTPLQDALTAVIRDLAGLDKFVIYPIPTRWQFLPYDIKYDIGATVMDILNQFMEILSTWQMYMDNDGVLTIEPIPSGEEAPTLPVDESTLTSNTQEADFGNVKNQVVIYGKNNECTYYTQSSATQVFSVAWESSDVQIDEYTKTQVVCDNMSGDAYIFVTNKIVRYIAESNTFLTTTNEGYVFEQGVFQDKQYIYFVVREGDEENYYADSIKLMRFQKKSFGDLQLTDLTSENEGTLIGLHISNDGNADYALLNGTNSIMFYDIASGVTEEVLLKYRTDSGTVENFDAYRMWLSGGNLYALQVETETGGFGVETLRRIDYTDRYKLNNGEWTTIYANSFPSGGHLSPEGIETDELYIYGMYSGERYDWDTGITYSYGYMQSYFNSSPFNQGTQIDFDELFGSEYGGYVSSNTAIYAYNWGGTILRFDKSQYSVANVIANLGTKYLAAVGYNSFNSTLFAVEGEVVDNTNYIYIYVINVPNEVTLDNGVLNLRYKTVDINNFTIKGTSFGFQRDWDIAQLPYKVRIYNGDTPISYIENGITVSEFELHTFEDIVPYPQYVKAIQNIFGSDIQYSRGNYVSYEGGIYVCSVDCIGIYPENKLYWTPIIPPNQGEIIYYIRVSGGDIDSNLKVKINKNLKFEYCGKANASDVVVTDNPSNPYYINSLIEGENYYCGVAYDKSHINKYSLYINDWEKSVDTITDGCILSFMVAKTNNSNPNTQIEVYNSKHEKLASGPLIGSNRNSVVYEALVANYTIYKIRYDAANTRFIFLGRHDTALTLVKSGGEFDNLYADRLVYERCLYELYTHSNLNNNITLQAVPNYALDVNNKIAISQNAAKPYSQADVEYFMANVPRTNVHEKIQTADGLILITADSEELEGSKKINYLIKSITYPLGVENSTTQNIVGCQIYDYGNLMGSDYR